MIEREKFDALGMQKAMAWERAKGELRSIVAAEGSRYSERSENGKYKFEIISEEIENFIKAFESEEYHL